MGAAMMEVKKGIFSRENETEKYMAAAACLQNTLPLITNSFVFGTGAVVSLLSWRSKKKT
jgi:hypothetical protein